MMSPDYVSSFRAEAERECKRICQCGGYGYCPVHGTYTPVPSSLPQEPSHTEGRVIRKKIEGE